MYNSWLQLLRKQYKHLPRRYSNETRHSENKQKNGGSHLWRLRPNNLLFLHLPGGNLHIFRYTNIDLLLKIRKGPFHVKTIC